MDPRPLKAAAAGSASRPLQGPAPDASLAPGAARGTATAGRWASALPQAEASCTTPLQVQVPPVRFQTRFTDDPDHYMDGNPAHRAPANVLDDDFDAAVKPRLTPPTADGEVAMAVQSNQHRQVVLWRGTTREQVQHMVRVGCVAGPAPDPAATRPSSAQAHRQVRAGRTCPEFSTRSDLSFSFGHHLAVVQIDSRYLQRGSEDEGGWICHPDAPLEVLETVDRTLGRPEASKTANAS